MVSLKDQLNKSIRGELNHFVYGVVVVYFFLERVPLMRHLVSLRIIDAEDPRVIRWVNVMAHHGGGGLKVTYGSVFFHWQQIQLLMIEDYAYEGADFRHDPEIPFPEG